MTPSCSSAPLRTPPHPSAPPLRRLCTASADDTLGTREILVMDSDKFPFYRAELYHQFHNDFQVRGLKGIGQRSAKARAWAGAVSE